MCTANYQAADGVMNYAKSTDGAAEIAMVSGGIGDAFSAYGAARSNNALLRSQQAAFLMDAQAYDLKALDAVERGRDANAWLGVRSNMEQAAVRNKMSASNVDINTGSAKDYQNSLKKMNEIDRYNTRYNAMNAAFGMQSAALNARQKARMSKMQMSNTFLTALVAGGKGLYSGYQALQGGK